MEKKIFDSDGYPLQKETDMIIRTAIDIHKNPGAGFLEIVYKDAFEYEYRDQDIPYEREKDYVIRYKNVILPHKFYADFVVFGKVIVEVKAKEGGIAVEDYAQTINYLKCSGCKIGLILNFGRMKLEIKRVVF
ncbi:MAG: GxxExxY protein [Bacteroidota bacterium]